MDNETPPDGEPDDPTVTTFVRSADLSLTKTGPINAVAGDTVTYTLPNGREQKAEIVEAVPYTG